MKGILEFNLEEPSDVLAHKRAVKATDAYVAFHNIANEVFRPARKHGYPDKELQSLIDSCGETSEGYGIGEEIVSKLEDKFYAILEEHGINLDDLE